MMPTRVGSSKRYTEEERQEILKQSFQYPSILSAAKNLGVSKEALTTWMEERQLVKKFYRSQWSKRSLKIRKAFSYPTLKEGAIKTGVTVSTLYKWQKAYGVVSDEDFESKRKKRAGYKRYSVQEKRRFAEGSLKYDSTVQAVAKMGVSKSFLISCCNQHGVEVRLAKPRYSLEYKREAIGMLKKGMSYTEVSRDLRIGRSTVLLWWKADQEGKL